MSPTRLNNRKVLFIYNNNKIRRWDREPVPCRRALQNVLTSGVCVSRQWRERRRENRKHQADPEVPVLHEPAVPGGVVQRQDVPRGGGAAGEQVSLHVLSRLILQRRLSWLTIPLPLCSAVPSWRPSATPRRSTTTTPAASGSLSSCISARRATSRVAESWTVSSNAQ